MSSFNYITHTYPILDPAPLEQTRIFSGENPLVEPPAGEYYENYIGYINLEADSVIRRFDCGISHAPRGKVVPDRSCDRLLIKVLLSGNLSCNGMPMRAGDLVIFPAGSMNSWRWESDASCLWCAWSGELAGTVATSLRRYPTCVPQAIPAAEQLAALVKPVVYNRCYDSIDAERYLVGFTEQLLAVLTPPKATPEQPHSPLIGRALALIEREYAHLTVASLAEALLVDSTYLSRVFRRELGETPKQAITRTRMVYADYYLVGTQYSLAHIAELVGYANYTNFYVAFRAHYGCSPELYRRTNSDIKL